MFRSGAGGGRLRLFEAGPAAPNLHLKNVLRVKSDVVSEPEADGARLRLLEPALLLRQICTSAPNFGAGSGFRSPGAAPTRCQRAKPCWAKPSADVKEPSPVGQNQELMFPCK